jgi:hypothetical protein
VISEGTLLIGNNLSSRDGTDCTVMEGYVLITRVGTRVWLSVAIYSFSLKDRFLNRSHIDICSERFFLFLCIFRFFVLLLVYLLIRRFFLCYVLYMNICLLIFFGISTVVKLLSCPEFLNSFNREVNKHGKV